MDRTNWRSYLEILGLFGVVVSIILLGYEIRQTRLVIVGETYLARAALSADASLSFSESDYLPEIWGEYENGGLDALTSDQRRRFFGYAAATKTRMDAYYLQYEIGLMDDEWYRYRFIPSAKSWRKRWEEMGLLSSDNTRPSFKAAVLEATET